LHHLRRLLLPGQAFQSAGCLFGFFGQRALGGAATGLRGLPATGSAPLPLGFLFLPTGQFLQPLH
jgi:hypothetical protein